MSAPARAAQRSRAASSSQSPQRGLLALWLASHARCLLDSLGRMHRRWVASLLTVLVIGIALALPTGLYILVKNLDTLAAS
jgi:cell division transport system permease protein